MSKWDHTGANAAELALLEAEARRKGMSVTALKMQKAVTNTDGSSVMAQVVGDWIGRWAPTDKRFLGTNEPVRRGTGWVEAAPLKFVPESRRPPSPEQAAYLAELEECERKGREAVAELHRRQAAEGKGD